MTLFFDRSLARRISDALALLGLDVVKHDDRFSPSATDEEWLHMVGKQGWVAVTRDERPWWNSSALNALVDHHVGCIILAGAGSRPRWYAVRVLARNWDTIEDLMDSAQRPFLCRLRLRQPVEFRQLPA
jgi:hypothetical protein